MILIDSAFMRRGILLCSLLCSGQLFGYEGSEHQFLTFLAAKQFNRCVEGTDIPALTPLQVRYMARANSGLVERSIFARMFNWRYYDRAEQAEQNAMWVVDTRLHEHFNELDGRLDSMEDLVAAYQDLGRIISYVQLVSSPARVVPVYTARFWRFSFSDRFDGYPLAEEHLTEVVDGDCGFLSDVPESYPEILVSVAARTLEAVQGPITGMPASWTAFWMPDEQPGNFGDYGQAGNNFGRRTEFRCGEDERCVLLNDDPLYADFALARHRDAVDGTLRVILRMQMNLRDSKIRAR